MTDILTMPAGRELDALVAEKVMETRPIRAGDFWTDLRRMGADQAAVEGVDPDAMLWPHRNGMMLGLEHYPPRYSTDIAAAWPIAEKLGLTVLAASLWPNDVFNDDTEPVPGWIAFATDERYPIGLGVEDQGYIETPVRAWGAAETAPLAICRAALAAAGAG